MVSKMHPVHLAVEQNERMFGGLGEWYFDLEIDRGVVFSMDPRKLMEIATALRAVPEVRNVLKAAEKEGHDVSRALQLFVDPPCFPESDLPW